MVSSIGNGSRGYDVAAIQQIRSQTADRLLKKIDTNQDGKITKDELRAAVEASGKPSSSALELFKKLDEGNKGFLTKQDLEDGLAKAAQSKPNTRRKHTETTIGRIERW